MNEPPISVLFEGVVYKRNPDGKQRSHRVYYQAPRGSGRETLHRDIWRRANPGKTIPRGWHIHHKDEDPFNNDPSNLVLLSPKQHGEEHAEPASEQQRGHLERVRPLAAAWHSSPEGIAWHREHGHKSWEGREGVERECTECGETFLAMFESRGRLCSRKCIARMHRREGRDKRQATCPICGAEFAQNKYRPVPETCGQKCGAQLRKARVATA